MTTTWCSSIVRMSNQRDSSWEPCLVGIVENRSLEIARNARTVEEHSAWTVLRLRNILDIERQRERQTEKAAGKLRVAFSSYLRFFGCWWRKVFGDGLLIYSLYDTRPVRVPSRLPTRMAGGVLAGHLGTVSFTGQKISQLLHIFGNGQDRFARNLFTIRLDLPLPIKGRLGLGCCHP